jgi:uncharacterized OB-fold protein
MVRIEPPTTDVSDAFWDATRGQRYLVQWCSACNAPIFYPREVCPTCLSADTLEWRASNGTGTIHAASVQRRPANPTMADRVPYVVALVDVDAGAEGVVVRVMSNVVNCDPETVRVGDPVRMVWEPLSDGRNLPLFEPTGAGR